MSRVLKAVMLTCLLACGSGAASAQVGATQTENAEKMKNIHRLLDVTKATETALEAIREALGEQRKELPQLPEKFWQELEREIKDEIQSEGFINDMAAIYERHLTDEDVRGLIAFYETPLGKKTLSILPQILAEASIIGQRRGGAAGQRVIEKLRAEGIFPAEGETPPPAAKPTGKP